MDYPTLPIGFHWAPLRGSWYIYIYIISSVSLRRYVDPKGFIRFFDELRWTVWGFIALRMDARGRLVRWMIP